MKSEKVKLLLDIFITFFKISPVTFGGGFAMIPILETEIVDKKKWIERQKIVDVFAVAQSVPGAIAVNSATFLGYQIAGIPGAVAGMLGMVIPTFLIIIIIAALFMSFQNNIFVMAALKGIRPIVVALIAAAAFKMGKAALKDRISWTIFILCTAILLVFRNLNLMLVILAWALVGIAVVKALEKINQAKTAQKADPMKEEKKKGDSV